MELVLRDVPYSLADGLGRRIRTEAGLEVLTLSAELAEEPGIEQSLRAAADATARGGALPLVKVRAIERAGAALRVVSDAPSGLRLSEVLAGIAASGERMEDAVAFEIAGVVIEAVATLHAAEGTLVHGAITPSHVVFSSEDGCLLTDSIFARAFESRQLNREKLWREFGIAMPASASAHRFTQRSDVTQLGALVLAIMLRRPLLVEEFPRGIDDLVIEATPEERGPHASAIRMWLQQALQLHPRAVFSSAIGAHQAYTEIIAFSGLRRARRVAAPFPWLERPATMAAPRWGFAR